MKLFNRKTRRATGQDEPRSPQQIQAEYARLCGLVGDREFQISVNKAQIAELFVKMHTLGKEMNAAQEKEARTKQEQAAAGEHDGTPISQS